MNGMNEVFFSDPEKGKSFQKSKKIPGIFPKLFPPPSGYGNRGIDRNPACFLAPLQPWVNSENFLPIQGFSIDLHANWMYSTCEGENMTKKTPEKQQKNRVMAYFSDEEMENFQILREEFRMSDSAIFRQLVLEKSRQIQSSRR